MGDGKRHREPPYTGPRLGEINPPLEPVFRETGPHLGEVNPTPAPPTRPRRRRTVLHVPDRQPEGQTPRPKPEERKKAA